MTDLITSNYIQPTAQKALNGELGLTSNDIAKSLGVDKQTVDRKINRNFDFLIDETFKISHLANKDYTVNVATAKYLVASWKSNLGKDYFKYLLKCEEFILEQLPKYKDHIEALEDYIKNKMKPRKSGGYISVPKLTIKMDMFGKPIYTIAFERKHLKEVTTAEKNAWELKHNNKVIKGLTKKQDSILENNVVCLPSTKELHKLNNPI